MPKVHLKIGKAIRTVRIRRGLSQQALAKKAKISQGFLSLLEKDGREPSLKMTVGLAGALGVPVELLLLLGAEGPRAKRYAKQLQQIAELADRILAAVSRR